MVLSITNLIATIITMLQLSTHSYRLHARTSILLTKQSLQSSARSLYTRSFNKDGNNNLPQVIGKRTMMSSDERVFPSAFNVYKGKGAVSFKPIAPTYSIYKQGPNKVVSREGTLLCEFAPAGSTPKEYDWTKKVSFALNLNECGEVLRLKEGSAIEFTHDPSLGCKQSCCCLQR